MRDLILHESIHNDGTIHWLTPPKILNSLGVFDLDPCAAPIPRPWDTAKEMWTLPDTDGLSRDWHGRVFLNPPYGNTKVFDAFMERMAKHGNGISLVFARTDAKWFSRWVYPYCTALFFLTPRLSFYKPDGTVYPNKAGGPSVLISYSIVDKKSLQESGLCGSLFVRE